MILHDASDLPGRLATVLPANQCLGIAVSGGGDSLALLIAGAEAGLNLRAATVDHGLRPESAHEALAVADMCARLSIPHQTLAWRWSGAGNLPAEARQGRLRALAGWAAGQGCDAVALGHTQDDVAENFLMRLSRQSGVDGLSVMRDRFTAHGVSFVRPFLGVSRESLRAYLRARSLTWAEDPSNSDPAYERARVRSAMSRLTEAGVAPADLAAVSQHMAEARQALDWSACALVDAHVREDAGALIMAPDLFDAPAELVRRIFAAALRWIASRPYPPRRDDLGRFVAAARAGRSATLHGVRLVPSGRDIILCREVSAQSPGSPDGVWDGRWHLTGPHRPGLTVRPLGENGLAACPDWRSTGRRREVLLSTPAIIGGDGGLIAAPYAGFAAGWTARTAPFRDQIATDRTSD